MRCDRNEHCVRFSYLNIHTEQTEIVASSLSVAIDYKRKGGSSRGETQNCWTTCLNPSTPTSCTDVPGTGHKSTQSDLERRSLTLEHVSSNYPEEEWTHVFTDGSATEATRDGGAGVYIKYRGEEAHIPIPTGKYSTNYKAEAEAL